MASPAIMPVTPPGSPRDLEVGWLTPDGVAHTVGPREAWNCAFEHGRPVRRFTSRKGQRHLSGLWWCATTGRHVGFESWLERDQLMLLDFDVSVVGIASQPMWLRWTDELGRLVAHAPDFFARRVDGSAVLVDCRPVERRRRGDAAKFDATAAACAQLGWEYRLLGAADPVLVGNVRWLAGYRHARHDDAALASKLRAAFAKPASLLSGAEAVGDPVAVLPTLFHLLWRGELTVDLSVPLNPSTPVEVRTR